MIQFQHPPAYIKGFQDICLSCLLFYDAFSYTQHPLPGSYPNRANFPALLGQAFVALGLATPEDPETPGEAPHRPIERSMYQAACGVNRLRNKEGTGHGRPWVPGVSKAEAQAAAELSGCIAAYMLDKLEMR